MTTRRAFLTNTSAVMAGVALSPAIRPAFGAPSVYRSGDGPIDTAIRIETDPSVRALVDRALESAKKAGASYADVRVTRTLGLWHFGFSSQLGLERRAGTMDQRLGVGIRVVANGAWGYAASPYWTLDEVAQLARDAVSQAKMNSSGLVAPVELGTTPVVTGSWRTPVRIDPFTVPIEEREEFMGSLLAQGEHYYRGGAAYPRSVSLGWYSVPPIFTRQERAVGTSEGSYVTQTTYESEAMIRFAYTVDPGPQYTTLARGLGIQAAGWEMLLDAHIPEQFPQLVAECEELMHKPRSKPGEIGRYDVVFDASVMASIVASTIGRPTQLDVALGLEANAGWTSYLNEPLEMLGTYNYQSPSLNVSANRSMAGGLATVKWDDECVAPEDFSLIKDGVLVDYQTTRAQASLLAPYYTKKRMPIRSRGCAGADSALSVTMQHMPNLVMEPGSHETSFADLVRDTPRGIAVLGGSIAFDWQGRNGASEVGGLNLVEIVDGKLGAPITDRSVLINTTELWKSVIAIGGRQSAKSIVGGDNKGQPAQSKRYSVSAVPAKVAKVAFI